MPFSPAPSSSSRLDQLPMPLTRSSPSVRLVGLRAWMYSGNSSSLPGSSASFDDGGGGSHAAGSGDGAHGEEFCLQITDAIKDKGIDDITNEFYIRLMFIVCYSAIFIHGLIGNGSVIWAVAHSKRLRSARNIFLLNLIVVDIILVLTAVPITPWYALMKNWQFGQIMCHFVPITNSCSVFVSSWSLTAIAIDKFYHINDPTKAPVSKRQAIAITVLIWAVSTIINVPYLMSFEMVDGYYYAKNGTPYCGHFCDETNWQSEDSKKIYGTMVMLLQFIIPMAIITFCYTMILNKVSKDMIIQNAQFSQSLTQKQRVDAVTRKKKVNYILIAMVLTFICCWLPLTAVNLLKDFNKEPAWLQAQPFLWSLVAHLIAMSLVVWNPLLFFWLTRKQKRMRFSKIINTSEMVASFANRIGSSVRRMSTKNSNKFDKARKRPTAMESEVSTGGGTVTSTTVTRPLLIQQTHSNGFDWGINKEIL